MKYYHMLYENIDINNKSKNLFYFSKKIQKKIAMN